MSDYYLVLTAAEDQATAASLARSAVGHDLPPSRTCMAPSAPTFWHLGEQGEGEEWHVTFKTPAARYPELEQHIIDEHAWTNPEVTAIPLVAGSDDYLRWLDASTKSS